MLILKNLARKGLRRVKDKEHDIPSQILKTILDCMAQPF